MQNFIVLGIIPGTNFQTSFNFWLLVGIGLASLPALLFLAHKRHAVRAYFAARKVARLINQLQLPA
jgi:hypothetical protein